MIELDDPNIVVIGGGTGSFTLLQELKHVTPNISAVVNMSDDGGSSGFLRNEYDVMPPGDVRQCLVALSNLQAERDMFSYRFPGELGVGFGGHPIGNLVLSMLEIECGDFTQAVRDASKILDITGQVIPVTTDKHELVMRDGDEVIRGEFKIGHRSVSHPDATVWLEPNARLHPDAEAALINADQIVIAPGNVYGSLLPALAVNGMKEVLSASVAQKVVVANLMSKKGQTDKWNLVDYIHKFEEYTGKDTIDVVLCNNWLPTHELFLKYSDEGGFPIDVANGHSRYREMYARVVPTDLIAEEPFMPDPKDKSVPRTVIRHDPKKVAAEIVKLIKEK